MKRPAIPAPETLDSNYAELLGRKSDLERKATDLRAAAAESRRRLAEMDRPKEERVGALIAGNALPRHATAEREHLEETLRELRDVQDAITELGTRIYAAHVTATRKVTAGLADEHKAMLGRLWAGVAAAAAARLEIDELHRQLRIGGMDPIGIAAAGEVVFDGVFNRSDPIAVELRKAARAGFIEPAQVPEGLR